MKMKPYLLRSLFVTTVLTGTSILLLYRFDSYRYLPRVKTELAAADDTGRSGLRAAFEPPRKNLYFMKTHKTGSSTLQNILIRYAWDKNLVVGLPVKGILFRSYPTEDKFSAKDMQPLPSNSSANMIFHHMRFDYEEVSSLLPEDTVFVTILRDPTTLFKSAFHYFLRDAGPFERAAKEGLSAFLAEPSRYFKEKDNGRFWWLAKNGMFYDLGYDNLNETSKYIKGSIKNIEEIFDLVILVEYFDMGLILLKSIMRWDVKDVAYVSMNARNSTSSTMPANSTLTAQIKDWNKADAAIYDYFNKTFWKRVETFGKDKMNAELKELQRWKNAYKASCFQDEMISNKDVSDVRLKMFNPDGVTVMQYQLRPEAKRNETCLGFVLPEFQWWVKLSVRQQPPISPKIRQRVVANATEKNN